MNIYKDEFVDVSHGIGVPFGGIGTGYGVLGRYGFVMPNFKSTPNPGTYDDLTAKAHYDYMNLHGANKSNFMSLILTVDGVDYAFQKEKLGKNTNTADEFLSLELLPFAKHRAVFEEAGMAVEMLAYSPMIPYMLSESSIPALCMELRVTNRNCENIKCGLRFDIDETNEQCGAVCAAFENKKSDCEMTIDAGKSETVNGFFAWFYPEFVTPSKVLTEVYTRYYTLRFASADDVVDYAMKNFGMWKEKMTEWQSSLDMPPAFKRLWFSSLSSVITSTMLSTQPYFFEIESPHPFINTMDVTIYSSWIYMINWPEIEKLDMYQYRKTIPKDGDMKGLVWHSLWSDKADYVEEPCYITRIYRDYLWYNDTKFLTDMQTAVSDAFNRILKRNEYDGLVESKHGNQSYDLWKMPGVSAYVNMPWLYALYSIIKMNKVCGVDIAASNGRLPEDILKQAADSFVKYLWNEDDGYFNCFYRTEQAESGSIPESVFTDQMFGRWLLLIERELDNILPADKIKSSVEYIYKNNVINDEANNFKGWSNGKLPGGKPCYDNKQYHAKTCWMGAQLNLASILGEMGLEKESLDVFYSLEKSLGNNHLAVGEWNRAITEDGKSCVLPEEPGKDTPRFPSYPRYKSCWEYLIRMLGLKIDSENMELTPFKSFDFSVKSIILAGCELTVSVKSGWTRIFVDGVEREKAIFERGKKHEIVFE